jgi:hypothetical protein
MCGGVRFTVLVLALLTLSGCAGHARDQAIAAAAAGAVAATANLISWAIEEDERRYGPRGKVDTDEVDAYGRRATLRSRVRCRGSYDRSYKVLCVATGDCYYERNDGTRVACLDPACDTVPPALAAWCD